MTRNGEIKYLPNARFILHYTKQRVTFQSHTGLAVSDNAFPISSTFPINPVDSCHMEDAANFAPSSNCTWQHSTRLFCISLKRISRLDFILFFFNAQWNGMKRLPIVSTVVSSDCRNYTNVSKLMREWLIDAECRSMCSSTFKVNQSISQWIKHSVRVQCGINMLNRFFFFRAPIQLEKDLHV